MEPNQSAFDAISAEQASVPRFETTPYKADGGCPLSGLLITALASALAALVCAWLVSFVSQWVYLIVFFPLALGLGDGFGGNFGRRRGQLRNGGCANRL